MYDTKNIYFTYFFSFLSLIQYLALEVLNEFLFI